MVSQDHQVPGVPWPVWSVAQGADGLDDLRLRGRRPVVLRRLFPALPPVSNVLLGRRQGGAPRIRQCLSFVDQAKRPIEQLRRLLAARSNAPSQSEKSLPGVRAASAEIGGPGERPVHMSRSLQANQRAAIGRQHCIAHRGAIDFYLAPSDQGRSYVGCSRSLALDQRLRPSIREGAPQNVALGLRLFRKGVPSGPVNRIPAWARISLRAVVSRGFCCRRMCASGCRAIIWRGL